MGGQLGRALNSSHDEHLAQRDTLGFPCAIKLRLIDVSRRFLDAPTSPCGFDDRGLDLLPDASFAGAASFAVEQAQVLFNAPQALSSNTTSMRRRNYFSAAALVAIAAPLRPAPLRVPRATRYAVNGAAAPQHDDDVYDVAICGAGPAGLATAAECASRGLKVCVGPRARAGLAEQLWGVDRRGRTARF